MANATACAPPHAPRYATDYREYDGGGGSGGGGVGAEPVEMMLMSPVKRTPRNTNG